MQLTPNHTKQCIIVIKLDQIYIWLICFHMLINRFASNAMKFVHFKCGESVLGLLCMLSVFLMLIIIIYCTMCLYQPLDRTETSLGFLW